MLSLAAISIVRRQPDGREATLGAARVLRATGGAFMRPGLSRNHRPCESAATAGSRVSRKACTRRSRPCRHGRVGQRRGASAPPLPPLSPSWRRCGLSLIRQQCRDPLLRRSEAVRCLPTLRAFFVKSAAQILDSFISQSLCHLHLGDTGFEFCGPVAGPRLAISGSWDRSVRNGRKNPVKLAFFD